MNSASSLTLVVVAVQAGEEERDRHALLRVVVVVAAPVDVVVARPGERRVVVVVEVERLRFASCSRPRPSRRDPSSRRTIRRRRRSPARRPEGLPARPRPIMSMLICATTESMGTVGLRVKNAEPMRPAFFARVPDEERRALRLHLHRLDRLGDLEHAHRARAVVVGAVADRVEARLGTSLRMLSMFTWIVASCAGVSAIMLFAISILLRASLNAFSESLSTGVAACRCDRCARRSRRTRS